MSRITKKNHKYEIAFGNDHVFGLFLQVFSRTLATEEPLFDRNYMEPEKLIAIAKHCGFIITEKELKML